MASVSDADADADADAAEAALYPLGTANLRMGFFAMPRCLVEARRELLPVQGPLQLATVLTTIALQFSPMRSVREIRRDRDVKRYDGYPYFAVLAGASQWCLYGAATFFFTGSWSFLTMVYANCLGVAFGIFYVTVFLNHAPPGDGRAQALRRYLLAGAALFALEVANVSLRRGEAIFWLGLLGSVGSAQIALSPFKTLPEVIRSRTTRSWPVDLCLWSFVQSACAGSFGLAAGDMWVCVPNVIGFVASAIQLAIIAAFVLVGEGGRGGGGARGDDVVK